MRGVCRGRRRARRAAPRWPPPGGGGGLGGGARREGPVGHDRFGHGRIGEQAGEHLGDGGAGVETHPDHLEIERTFETDAESSTPSRPINRRARAGDSFDTVAARSYHPAMGPLVSRLPRTPFDPGEFAGAPPPGGPPADLEPEPPLGRMPVAGLPRRSPAGLMGALVILWIVVVFARAGAA